LRLLSDVDMGLGANPADDSELYFVDPRANALLPIVSGRSDYDRDLIRALQERAGHENEIAARRVVGKQAHAILRRKAFFERPDEGWRNMLPYSMLDLMLGAGKGEQGALDSLKAQIIQGINQGEGLVDTGEVVSLRLARGVPGEVLSYRQFPGSDFVLGPVRPGAPCGYIEYSPPALEFVYRPGSNGAGAKRPTLRIDLDLLELLARMSSGYAPTAAEWRGPLVNLHVFRTQLAQEPYDQLVLVDTVQERRFRPVKQGVDLVLSQQGVGNGSR
jgi:hypothetical protein